MITVETKENKKQNPSYPCLKIYRDLIVLFTKLNTGMSLKSDGFTEAGRYSTEWCEDIFVPYEWEVTLNNTPSMM